MPRPATARAAKVVMRRWLEASSWMFNWCRFSNNVLLVPHLHLPSARTRADEKAKPRKSKMSLQKQTSGCPRADVPFFIYFFQRQNGQEEDQPYEPQ